jgi:hypothetical protein
VFLKLWSMIVDHMTCRRFQRQKQWDDFYHIKNIKCRINYDCQKCIQRNASAFSLVTFLMIELHLRYFCLLKPPLQSFVEGSKCFPSAWFQGCTYSLSQWVSICIWQSHQTLATVPDDLQLLVWIFKFRRNPE